MVDMVKGRQIVVAIVCTSWSGGDRKSEEEQRRRRGGRKVKPNKDVYDKKGQKTACGREVNEKASVMGPVTSCLAARRLGVQERPALRHCLISAGKKTKGHGQHDFRSAHQNGDERFMYDNFEPRSRGEAKNAKIATAREKASAAVVAGNHGR